MLTNAKDGPWFVKGWHNLDGFGEQSKDVDYTHGGKYPIEPTAKAMRGPFGGRVIIAADSDGGECD